MQRGKRGSKVRTDISTIGGRRSTGIYPEVKTSYVVEWEGGLTAGRFMYQA